MTLGVLLLGLVVWTSVTGFGLPGAATAAPQVVSCPGSFTVLASSAEAVAAPCPAGAYDILVEGVYSPWPNSADDSDPQHHYGQWRSVLSVQSTPPISPGTSSFTVGRWEADTKPDKDSALSRVSRLRPFRINLATAGTLSVVAIDAPGSYLGNRGRVVVTIRPVQQPAHTQFGVHLQIGWTDPASDLAALNEAAVLGASFVRFGPGWDNLEPQAGVWDQHNFYRPRLLTLLQTADRLGLRVILTFGQPPAWAAPGTTRARWCPPTDSATYSRALGRLLETTAGRVAGYEIWNEPNWEPFWCGGPNAAAYVDLLRKAAQVIRVGDPGADVLGGSLSGTDIPYLQEMYRHGARGTFDALALHPYANGLPPWDCSNPRASFACRVDAAGIGRVRDVMTREAGDASPIWLTEFGWSSVQSSVHPDGVGESLQAAYLAKAASLMSEWDYVPVAIWYELQNRSHLDASDRERYFGLFRDDNSRKPAWAEFHAAAGTSCEPRPPVRVSSARTADGRIRTTITATSNATGTSNRVLALTLGTIRNGTVQIEGIGPVQAGQRVALTSISHTVTLIVARSTTGQGVFVPLTVTDGCGEWRTFIGAGA